MATAAASGTQVVVDTNVVHVEDTETSAVPASNGPVESRINVDDGVPAVGGIDGRSGESGIKMEEVGPSGQGGISEIGRAHV